MPTIKDKKTGDVVSQQPYTAEGTQRAETIVQANPDWEIDYAPGGTQNAPDMRESYQLGGQVGKPGFGQRPSPTLNPYGDNPYGEVGGGNKKPIGPQDMQTYDEMGYNWFEDLIPREEMKIMGNAQMGDGGKVKKKK